MTNFRVAKYFYPRSPCGERRKSWAVWRICKAISIHALLAESDLRRLLGTVAAKLISIHALLAESDADRNRSNSQRDNFYPRSPCGERLNSLCLLLLSVIFLSTLSLRRATESPLRYLSWFWNFYPRSPCGERLLALHLFYSFNINFYPRSPCGERRAVLDALTAQRIISIHALLAESDSHLSRKF